MSDVSDVSDDEEYENKPAKGKRKKKTKMNATKKKKMEIESKFIEQIPESSGNEEEISSGEEIDNHKGTPLISQ